MVNFLYNRAKKRVRTMWNVASYYDTILTVHQQDELNDLIRQAMETNEDIEWIGKKKYYDDFNKMEWKKIKIE